MKRLLVSTLLVIVLLTCGTGCKDSTSPDGNGHFKTPASALDPEPPDDMVRYFLDSGTFHIVAGARPKRHSLASLTDSIDALVAFAVSKVTTDPATHIPYVWGGKHITAATEWAQPPESNDTCEARIGLDCSGFVQYCFEEVGFGRQAPELNVASLADLKNWDFIAKKGYYVFGLPNPKANELLPGDILIFSDGSGSLVHTGIFWTHNANINGAFVPAFINSSGFSSCSRNYAREADGKLTGIVASPIGDWENRLFMAIRITNWDVSLSALGENFAIDFLNGAASFVLDRTSHRFYFGAGEDSTDVSSYIFLSFIADGVTDTGTYPIPVLDINEDDVSKLWYSGLDRTFPDSLYMYGAPPPDWWKGTPPTPEPGEVKITTLSLGQYYGSMAGTFHYKSYSYYSRYEDSTYTIDTTTYTTSVTRYYYYTTEVVGRFGGLLGYK